MIYCDNAATTKISEEVLEVMLPYLTDNYGNASSLYSMGYQSKKAIEAAREQVANAINAQPNEIYFTSGATESNNWVIKNLIDNHTLTVVSGMEHPSVYNTCEYLKKEIDAHIVYINPESNGIINSEIITETVNHNIRLKSSQKFVSVMAVNNEIGTIQPIRKIGEFCKDSNAIFHTDATQAIGHIPIDVKKMNIDFMSLSGHKFHAPKGIGVLYIRNGIKIKPLLLGGLQENSFRAGTENVANIVGLGKAIEIATRDLYRQKELKEKSRILLDKLLQTDNISLNGEWKNRIAGNINICVKDVDAETLVLQMDTEGICISAGSACHSGNLEPSRTLKAIGLSDEQATSSVRISLDCSITTDEIKIIAEKMRTCIERIRKVR